ncbi:hypothetical protein LG329_11785 [Virgibacillus necropolis]|uniref:nucleotidyltransferase domain-containing protein n=1 Tax=Virgibacillus necropolis TaxID=163877 RepID=UPI00384DB4D0
METKLMKLLTILNNINVTWAVGGSYILSCYGLVRTVNDIDLLVDKTTAEEVEITLSKYAKKEETISKEPFLTEHFSNFNLDGTSIDVMGGFNIRHQEGIYDLTFDHLSITNYKKIRNVQVPLSSLEDWYILYSLIPGKQYKANLIERYWNVNGIENPSLLYRSMEKPLPIDLRLKLNQILNI